MKMSFGVVAVCCLLAGLQAVGQTVAVLPSGEKYIAGQMLVQLRGELRGQVRISRDCFGVPQLDELCRREGVTGVERVIRNPKPGPATLAAGSDLLFLLSFGAESDIPRLLSEFVELPEVAGAWPNAVLDLCQADQIPNDPRYGEQWHLPRIRAPQAWDSAHGDSSVIIAVIDDGLDWTQEEIAANLWINSAEDINGNGRFDLDWYPDGDLDGVDQDGNGYTDDVIGFDYVGGDPDPMPADTNGHGTGCWGAANAVTNNGLGVAAPTWNCRAMALRCGSSAGINLGAAIAAVNYALDKGAWVFSMSFSSASPYEPLNNACQVIWSAGALSVAAAGGETDSTYPAAFPNVIAVAASDRDDKKAPFSAFGDWIDVCAPGVGILSTLPTGLKLYDGTSIATPIVAGVLAWFKSAYPGMTNDSALTLLYNYCDSMPDSLYRAGLLGHGRVAMTDSAVEGVTDWRRQPGGSRAQVTLARRVLAVAGTPGREAAAVALLDASGRSALELRPGPNDVSRLAPGVYFVREADTVRKVVLTR